MSQRWNCAHQQRQKRQNNFGFVCPPRGLTLWRTLCRFFLSPERSIEIRIIDGENVTSWHDCFCVEHIECSNTTRFEWKPMRSLDVFDSHRSMLIHIEALLYAVDVHSDSCAFLFSSQHYSIEKLQLARPVILAPKFFSLSFSFHFYSRLIWLQWLPVQWIDW